ncbi:hypothetical protein DOTSEDRAFT_71539 [Dothistroma septosporum NZE10]|uniref:Uncharacterized protein n=1 Tax=Dothistroma septosporum (strain NZE10 / CBS 128990) TaxID=675120 RepID=N1PR03_DOTSN|nr:hypothetical protein DOTSEDRAFT_71539 [Dothistroma septosporum NZE10]
MGKQQAIHLQPYRMIWYRRVSSVDSLVNEVHEPQSPLPSSRLPDTRQSDEILRSCLKTDRRIALSLCGTNRFACVTPEVT